MSEEVKDDPSHLINAMYRRLEKIRKRGHINTILEYFDVEKPKFGRFYLLPKIHKRLHSVPGRPVISNPFWYKKYLTAFLDFHLKPTAAKVESHIKDTNDFLRKLYNLPKNPIEVISCTIDVVGLYTNISNGEGLLLLKKALDKRRNKIVYWISYRTELVLKNNYLEFNDKFRKQKEGTAIGTEFAPTYAIIFKAALVEEILKSFIKKCWLWWRYIYIFIIWHHGENELKQLIDKLNKFHPTIKFNYAYSWASTF